MTARGVHAVLAAGVARPNLIDGWQSDPHALKAQGIEPAAMDLPALRKFSGFTTKVRHNGVRHVLPMTLRLMGAAGLEIDLFAAYASFCAANGQTYTGSVAERCRKLSDFMERWLDLSLKDHALLWDLIRHELAPVTLAELPAASDTAAPRAASSSQPAAPADSSVPRIAGNLLLYEMQSDPSATAAAMSQKTPDLGGVELATRYWGYWRPEQSADVHVVELDAFGYYALSNADGVRSASALSELLGLGPQPSPNFLRSLSQFADVGIIRFA
jgi:hypothetical protein